MEGRHAHRSRLRGLRDGTKIYHVYVATKGSATLADKGTLNNDYDISATDINASGQVTATIDGGATPFEAAVNTGGGFVSLTNQIDPAAGDWTLFSASAINDSGQIVGYGYLGGQQKAYLLTPIAAPKYTLSGVVFNDSNRNGNFDAGEKGSGVRTIFLDDNKNGKLDAGERSVQSDAAGKYTFANLAPGTYNVARVLPGGFKLTNGTGGANYRTVTIGASNVSGFNLGSGYITLPAKTGTVIGTLWNDFDNDGFFNPWESRTGVRTVFIDQNGNGKLDRGERSTQSDAKGRYGFSNVAIGKTKISRLFPLGYHLSNPSPGTGGKDVVVTVASGKLTVANLGTHENRPA